MVLNFGARSHFRLLIACFITFYVCTAMKQKQQQNQCIIYWMHCQSLLSENSGQISIRDSNTKCTQIEFEFQNRSSKIQTSFNITNFSGNNVDYCNYLEQYDVNLRVLHSANKNWNEVSDVWHQDFLADLVFGQWQPELAGFQWYWSVCVLCSHQHVLHADTPASPWHCPARPISRPNANSQSSQEQELKFQDQIF